MTKLQSDIKWNSCQQEHTAFDLAALCFFIHSFQITSFGRHFTKPLLMIPQPSTTKLFTRFAVGSYHLTFQTCQSFPVLNTTSNLTFALRIIIWDEQLFQFIICKSDSILATHAPSALGSVPFGLYHSWSFAFTDILVYVCYTTDDLFQSIWMSLDFLHVSV